MTTPRTGRPRGQPHIPLRSQPYCFALAFSDVMQEITPGISAQKAYLLAVGVFLSTTAEPIPPSAPGLSKKLRTTLDKFGGNVVSYELPSGGNKTSKQIKESVQPVNALDGMAKRFNAGDDLDYRRKLGSLYKRILRGGPDICSDTIRALLVHLGEDYSEAVKPIERLQCANYTTASLPD